jgi:hypothetical protein
VLYGGHPYSSDCLQSNCAYAISTLILVPQKTLHLDLEQQHCASGAMSGRTGIKIKESRDPGGVNTSVAAQRTCGRLNRYQQWTRWLFISLCSPERANSGHSSASYDPFGGLDMHVSLSLDSLSITVCAHRLSDHLVSSRLDSLPRVLCDVLSQLVVQMTILSYLCNNNQSWP